MSPASANGRRFWVVFLGLVLLNVIAWVAYHHWYGQRLHDLLQVDSFTPGQNALVTGTPAFAWRFNLDVAESSEGQAPGTVTPAVAGRWEWSDPRTLYFLPDGELPKATKLTFTLASDRVKTLQGIALGKPHRTSVVARPLQLQTLRQAGTEEGNRYVLELQFSDRVVPAEVAARAKLTKDGNAVKVKALGEEASEVVRLVTDPLPEDQDRSGKATVRLTISEGLVGLGGPEPMGKAFEGGLQLEKPLAIIEARGESPSIGMPSIYLLANGTLDCEALKSLVTIEPPVAFEVSPCWSGMQILGGFKPGSRYTIKVSSPHALQGKKGIPRADTFSVYLPDREPGVEFPYDEGYLGSGGNRTLLLRAANVPEITLSLWRVYDSNIVAWRNSGRHYRWEDATQYSRPVAKKTFAVRAERNEVKDIPVALDELLVGTKLGDGVYRVTVSTRSGTNEGDVTIHDHAVVTLSDIGLTAKRGRQEVVAWAVSLASARPMEGVRVRVFSNKNQLLGEGVTGPEGLVRIADLHPAEGETPAVLLAEEKGQGQLTWLDLASGAWSLSDLDVKGHAYLRDRCEAFLYTDRGVYRPGDTLCLRSIVRDVEMKTPKAFPVKWTLQRPDLRDWRSHTMTLDADGAAEWALELPADLPTGRWTAILGIPGAKEELGSATFYVEEFVPNRIAASMKLLAGEDGKAVPGANGEGTPARLTLGEKPVKVEVQADYLFGQPAAGLGASLAARMDPVYFSAQGWEGWTFGDVAKVQSDATKVRGTVKPVGEDEDRLLDASGHGAWDLPLGEMRPKGQANAYAGPWRLSVSSGVKEPGGRAVTVNASTMVDLLPWYIGVARPADVIPAGNEMELKVALVSPEGQVAAVDVTLTMMLYREVWNSNLLYDGGRYRYDSQRRLELVEGSSAEVRIQGGRGTAKLKASAGGAYVLQLAAKEEARVLTSLPLYFTEGQSWDDNISREKPERLEVSFVPVALAGAATQPATAGKESRRYALGERVGVLVRSPFPGRLLLTVETDKVVKSQVVEMTSAATVVPIEVTPECVPNAYVTASVIRQVEPNAKWRVHRACGVARLSVDPSNRRLDVAIQAPKEIRPDSALAVAVQVKDAAGQAVPNAAVALAGVDEGILQLTVFPSPDPLAFFFGTRALAVGSGDLYGQLMPEVPRPGGVSSVGGDNDEGQRHLTSVPAKRVKPVALVSPVVHTDAAGWATVQLQVPEFNGQLRLMAVSYAPELVGSANAGVLVRSPVMVQSSLPRFAAPGDTFAAPVTIFNNAGTEGTAELAVEVTGPLSTPWKPEPLKLAAGEQKTIIVPFAASEAAGVAKVSFRVTMGSEAAQESNELPIRPASPTITEGGYLAVAADQPAELKLPAAMLQGTQRVEVRITPWPALQLPEGLDYLERYPYGCAEQTVSSCFPLVYLADLGPQIAPGVFEKKRVEEKLQSGVIRLMGMQTADGGIAMWPGSKESWPWATVYAAHFLVEAERAGHAIPQDFRDRLLAKVRQLLTKSGEEDLVEAQGYACYVLALAGKPDRAAMSRLEELTRTHTAGADATNASAAGQARLYLSLAWIASGRKDLAAVCIPQTLPAPRPQRQQGGNVASPVRDRAMLVNALLAVDSENAALPVIVQELADGGRKGHWRSTQDCAFATMAIGRYLRQARTQTPFQSVDLRAGDEVLAHADEGQSAVWSSNEGQTSPMPAQARAMRVEVKGPADARAHLSWNQTGVPLSVPPAADHGLKIRRRYLDVAGKPLDLEKLRSGDLVTVELTVESATALENLVLEDLLPGGLEVENPRLETTARQEAPESQPRGLSVNHLDIRDDRVVVFADLPEAGTARYQYLARAVTPGEYRVPPVRGECMYDIGINSLSSGGGTMKVVPQR